MSIHSTPVAIKKWRARTELYGATAEEWLRRWDAGETCWTLEMGGLGPGYEQAIQILVAEIVRDYLGKPMPGWGEKFGDWGDATVSRIDAKDPETGKYAMGGFSGAQVGAAKWLAWWFLMDSPASIILAAERHGDKDRSMMVSKFYPKAELCCDSDPLRGARRSGPWENRAFTQPPLRWAPARELTAEERVQAAINAVTRHPFYQELVLDVMHDNGEYPEDFL